MYCLHPIKVRKLEYADYTDEEWRSLPPDVRARSRKKDGSRKKKILPWNGEYMELPCGHCLACIDRKASDWSFRLLSEEYGAAQSVFITLTYDEDHKPKDGKVCPNDIERFNDTFRSHFDEKGIKVRFFLMSEYGPQTFRPHYHGIYFFDKKAFKNYVEFAKWLESHVWKMGSVTASYPFGQRIHYIARYSFKDLKLPEHLQNTNFMRCSRRPGIGARYVDDPQFIAYMKSHPSPLVPTVDGHRRLPRYYKDKIYDEEEKEIIKNEYDKYQNALFLSFAERHPLLDVDELNMSFVLSRQSEEDNWMQRKKKIYLKRGKRNKL